MSKLFIVALVVVMSAACAYESPVAPSPSPVVVPTSTPVQIAIRIAGPDTWWTDRLFAIVTVFDQNGAELNANVECDSTDGIFEPRASNTFTRKGVLVIGVKAGSVLTCRAGSIEGSYNVSALDWRIIDGGGTHPPATVPVTPAPAPKPTTGS